MNIKHVVITAKDLNNGNFVINFKLINFVVHFVYHRENVQYLFLYERRTSRYKNLDNIVHRNASRSGGRYFATRLRTTRAIRTQLLFHPIVWIFFVVSFSRLLRYSCSLAPNVPVFPSFCILSVILVREHLFDSFGTTAFVYRYVIALKLSKRRVKFDELEK